jgi:hypothetical protein
MDHEEYKGLISRKYWVSHILQMSKILLMFSFGAVMLLHLATLCLGQEVQANDSNRAFSVPSPMIFSTSSPSATSGGGQSNSPVCTCSFFILKAFLFIFHVFLSVFDFRLTVTRYPSHLPLSRIGAHFGYRSARPLPVHGSATENFTLSYRHNHKPR